MAMAHGARGGERVSFEKSKSVPEDQILSTIDHEKGSASKDQNPFPTNRIKIMKKGRELITGR